LHPRPFRVNSWFNWNSRRESIRHELVRVRRLSSSEAASATLAVLGITPTDIGIRVAVNTSCVPVSVLVASPFPSCLICGNQTACSPQSDPGAERAGGSPAIDLRSRSAYDPGPPFRVSRRAGLPSGNEVVPCLSRLRTPRHCSGGEIGRDPGRRSRRRTHVPPDTRFRPRCQRIWSTSRAS
jgi:hypothetical protein